MIKTTAMILEELKDYVSPQDKISRMVKDKKLFPIKQGLYETDNNTPAFLLAGSILGPSYISFEYALSYYGLIPERVCTVTSATYDKKKQKKYQNDFGNFTFRDVPKKAFPYEVLLKKYNDYYYRIASPEKALCDKIYTVSPVKTIKEMTELLINDLRIDEEDLKNLNIDTVEKISQYYGATNMKKLVKAMRRMR